MSGAEFAALIVCTVVGVPLLVFGLLELDAWRWRRQDEARRRRRGGYVR
jgi:hypothetical protein